MPTKRRLAKMEQVLRSRQRDLAVVCENIYDPHNVSAILRTCDAVGAATMYLWYFKEPFPKLGKQSSASARKWVKTDRFSDGVALQAALKAADMRIYATALMADAVPHTEIDWTKPSAIIFGNEHRGVSEHALHIADQVVRIPMHGMIASLNVSVAAAVILYEACRQRMRVGLYPRPDIDDAWLGSTLEEWARSR